MSIFTALKTADNSLNAAAIAIRTIGHNIANAGNEDYNRQRVGITTLPPSGDSNLLIGTGVQVSRVERIMNQSIEASLRDALSKFEFLGAQDLALDRLEGIFNELQGTGLEESIVRFFDDAANLQNLPDDPTARSIFAFSARTLAESFRERDREVRELRQNLNTRVENTALDFNRLTASIAELNQQIVFAETGASGSGVANDLRDVRDAKIRELSGILNIVAVETTTGAINVTSGSDVLVEGGRAERVEIDAQNEGDVRISSVRFERNGKALAPASGSLAGLLLARDDVVKRYRDDLSTLAASMISEINKVHVNGVGLTGRSDVTSFESVDSVSSSLAGAGLPFSPRTGSFDIKVKNEVTGQVKTFNIHVDLDGLNDDDTSLESLRADIAGALSADYPAITTSITSQLQLRMRSSDDTITFSFANDTSHALASLGVSTLFTGESATDMGVANDIADNSNLIATGRGGGPKDTANIKALVDLRGSKVLQNGETTFEEYYRGFLGILGVERAQVRDLVFHQETITEHLRNERAAFSGVNIDEESIELIKFQRMYQGSARYLGVVDSILQELFNII